MVHTFLIHDLLPSTGWFQDLNTIRQNKQFFIFTTHDCFSSPNRSTQNILKL